MMIFGKTHEEYKKYKESERDHFCLLPTFLICGRIAWLETVTVTHKWYQPKFIGLTNLPRWEAFYKAKEKVKEVE